MTEVNDSSILLGITKSADRRTGGVRGLGVERIRATRHRLLAGPTLPDPTRGPTDLVLRAEGARVLRLLVPLNLEELLAGGPPIACPILPGQADLLRSPRHLPASF